MQPTSVAWGLVSLQLAVLPALARTQPNMGEPLSEILMVSSDDEFNEALHGPSRRGTTLDHRSGASCWAVLFVNGEKEQLPSISLLEVRLCMHTRAPTSYISKVCMRGQCILLEFPLVLSQVLSTFPDMPAISFGVADAKAVPRATIAAGLEGLQTSQLVFYGSGGGGQPPHAPVAPGVSADKLQFEWAWLKGQALQAGCATAPAAAAHEKGEL
jgi:hypothetical protein